MRVLVSLALLALATPAIASPKYYLLIGKVEGAKEIGEPRVHKLLDEEIARHPEFLTGAIDLPSDPKALALALKEKHVKGYFVTVRLQHVTREMKERPGKRPLLERGVKLSLIGTTIPEEVAAFSGDAEATAGVEVMRGKIDEAEEADVLADALKEAATDAMATTLRKLKEPPMPAPTSKKKRKL